MKNLYAVENGVVTELSPIEAQKICQREDFGQEVILVDCETATEALRLAKLYDEGQITYDNINGQEAIALGLVGLGA